MRIAGCHVGPHAACVAEALRMVAKKQPLLNALVRLARTQALTAFRLLGTSALRDMTYYWSITPTSIAHLACVDYDARVKKATELVLSPEGYIAPAMQPERLHRAQIIDQLPTRIGGAGHTRSVDHNRAPILRCCRTACTIPRSLQRTGVSSPTSMTP